MHPFDRSTARPRSHAALSSPHRRLRLAAPLLIALLFLPVMAANRADEPPAIGERPAVERHMSQSMIEKGSVRVEELFHLGEILFEARFNALDGQGRPGSTGTGAPRVPDQPAFIRTSSPDSNSCAGCHNQPAPGGAGDFVANVFVLAQAQDPVVLSVEPAFSNERNTLGMHGSGPIEMLAREMTAELHRIRDDALARARSRGPSAEVTRELVAKGVGFGRITARGDGRVDPSEIEGVDWDLIVKPFHQKGAVVSLREFTNNAMNHHHGMQSVERFGRDVDADGDGFVNELSVGDITAVTLFQASLATPGRLIRNHRAVTDAVRKGESLFSRIGCAGCHTPVMELRDRHFSEPNPYNPPGNLAPGDVARPVVFDMTRQGQKPRLERTGRGGALVRAFTDLKRHDLNDADYDHFDNEMVPQGNLYGFASPSDFYNVPADAARPTGQFLTRKLWDVGNTDPYGHRGDLTTITEAIHFHGGEGRASRDAFFALPSRDRDALVEFLKCLQVLPEGSHEVVHAAEN